jgi:short-subunit dehydrogenase
VVVITGASSGIGRATARAFAEAGHSVIMVARDRRALQEAARSIEGNRGQTLVLPADVTDPSAVGSVARDAMDKYGRLDVWVNNAGVMLVGRLDEAPLEVSRRVIETNLLGYIYGARASVEQFRSQGWGHLVNVSSILGIAWAPYLSAYVATKHGVEGFSRSLRAELRATPRIRVSTVLPGAVATGVFSHLANYSGRTVRPIPPVAHPSSVARAIVQCVARPRDRVVVGSAAWAARLLVSLSPRVYAWLIRVLSPYVFGGEPVPPTEGNLFEHVD